MSDIRDQILSRLKNLKKSRYWLGQEAAARGIVGNRQTVFRFLRGERDTSSTVVSGLLDILELEIRPKPKGQGKCK
jgi:hypothetical protein